MYNILADAHKPKFGPFFTIARPDLFSLRFPFFATLLSLPFAFHILSGCRKKLGVNYGQIKTWKWVLDPLRLFMS